ncbi:PepSY-associated TM helix domain-containing protein [Sphingomonas sp. NCPPB 2930]
MKRGFRQTMSGLHTWCGLTCGWLLCAIFFTGTLSVFREPITRWMEARPALPTAVDRATAPALHGAASHLAQHAAGARFWRIELPQRAGDALLLAWQPAGAPRGSLQTAALDPATGALLPAPWGRRTEGGRHFMSFHYMLHGGTPGFWLVGWISMCMLVALVSGVAVHRRIFADFFTLRLGKGPRSWLDAHNATAVLALPFLFMIVYSGLAIFYTSYLPAPLQAAYGSGDDAYGRFQAELSHQSPPPRRARTGQAAALHPLAPLLQRAEAITGRPAQMLLVEQPGDAAMAVRVIGQGDEGTRALLDPKRIVGFDGVTGVVLQVQMPPADAAFATEDIHATLEALHLARFGGWTVKWLYFFSGLLGTAMVATGTLLFSAKRRQKNLGEFGAATARVYRAVEVLNVAAVAGTVLASIAYFYGNRLLPAGMAGRAGAEIQVFFGAWAASLVHAALRPGRRAWVEQSAAAALLCLGLPLLNHLAVGQHLVGYLRAGDGVRAAVESTVLAFGGVLACIAWRVRHGGPRTVPAQRVAAGTTAARSPPPRRGWSVASRVAAAAFGGYAAVSASAAALALLLPRTTAASRADGVLVAGLLGFALYTGLAVWAFGARSAGRAWAGIALVTAGAIAVVAWSGFQP